MKNKNFYASQVLLSCWIFFFFLLFTSQSFSQEVSASPSALLPPPVSSPAPTATPLLEKTDQHSSNNQTQGTTDYCKYSSLHVDGPYIAMTFDDGPSPTLTPRLLDILKEKGVKATFFVIGQNVLQAPQIVARAAQEGHEIGNHSWSHPAFTKISTQRVEEEIEKTSQAIFQAIGKKPTLLRPPYGAMNARLGRMIEKNDQLTIIFWSVDPLDWKSPGPKIVAQRLIAGAKPGAILLSHDIKAGTIQAIPTVIDELKSKGYQFVTVSELIALKSNKTPKAISINQ